MTLWVVRAGRHGEREAFALENGIVVIGWYELPDLSDITSRDELEAIMRKLNPDAKPASISVQIGQVWAFRSKMKEGDLVALPLKTRSAIAFGKVVGPYQYNADFPADARHHRHVKWLNTDVPRTELDSDIRFSLGGAMTVFRIRRNNAEERIWAKLEGKQIPDALSPETAHVDDTSEDEGVIDLEGYAQDQVIEHISQKFRGHELSYLVAGVLQAQGYKIFVSPPGADGGVDIIAGRGSMGFDPPKLCVQVKSSDSPVDVSVLRELQGVMKNFGADQGLIASWGGFKQSVLSEARRHYFEIRLWDAGDIVRAIQENYEELPEELQADLPLKRVWMLVAEG